MTERTERPSLKDLDAHADRDGQDIGQDSPLDLERPADLKDGGASAAMAEAIDRATAAVGHDDGKR